jgi:hypothetical protein
LSAWILWSQSGLKQIASGNGLVLDVKADRFLVAARDYYYELRSLVDGALITTVLRPLSEISVAAARAGLAVDGSYLWIRTDRYLDAFEADGTRWLHIADNFGLSQILATPEAVYAGRGPLAPEVQRFPRTGVPTVTSGVLGTFDTWLLDGKWFVTVSPGNLTRVYATDGTPVSGLLTNCRTPFAASGNLFWCVSSLVSGLQQFDLSIGPTPTPTIVPLSGDTSALKLGQNGLLLANQRIDLTPSGASVTTVPVPGPGTLLAAKGDVWLGSGFLNDAYLRSGFLGNLASIRPFGCGAVNGLASSETGLLAISTQLGLLGYDTLTRTFRWSIEGTSLSTGLYYSLPGGSPTLSNDGSKLFFNGKLYALGPQPTLLADVAAFNGSIVNPTLEFVGGKKAGDPATWQVRRLPSGEIVQETSANPNYAPDVPVVNHSGRSVAVTAPGAVWLYRDAALTGSYANVKPGVWLSESLLYAEGLILNQQGVKQPAPVCGQDVGAVGVSFAGGLQVLPGTQFYQHGQVCDYGSTSPTPPAVSLFQNTMPAWLIGDLGAYVVGPRQEIWLKPWH